MHLHHLLLGCLLLLLRALLRNRSCCRILVLCLGSARQSIHAGLGQEQMTLNLSPSLDHSAARRACSTRHRS